MNPWPGQAAIEPALRPSTDLPDAARRIQRLERQLRTMAAEINAAEVRERERIACQLHDELGQRIVLVRLKLGELRAAAADDLPRLIDELTELVGLTAAAARAATFDLGQPAWHGGLFGVLEALGSNLARQAGLEVRIDAPPPGLRLAEPQLGVVCRVVREMCLNVHKHARASQVGIASAIDGRCLRVSVQDDGDGFDLPHPCRWAARRAGGFGLASVQTQLRALGGDLDVVSERGRGTCATLVLPLHPGAGKAARRTA
jgi:signal transduction histidine kinase